MSARALAAGRERNHVGAARSRPGAWAAVAPYHVLKPFSNPYLHAQAARTSIASCGRCSTCCSPRGLARATTCPCARSWPSASTTLTPRARTCSRSSACCRPGRSCRSACRRTCSRRGRAWRRASASCWRAARGARAHRRGGRRWVGPGGCGPCLRMRRGGRASCRPSPPPLVSSTPAVCVNAHPCGLWRPGARARARAGCRGGSRRARASASGRSSATRSTPTRASSPAGTRAASPTRCGLRRWASTTCPVRPRIRGGAFMSAAACPHGCQA